MISSVKIYSYSRCSTCRKALKWLQDNNITYESIDIVSSPPETSLLVKALEQLENRKSLFNTSGLSYRALGKEVLKTMTDDEALKALSIDGKLIKRPLLITEDGRVLVGFKQDAWHKALID